MPKHTLTLPSCTKSICQLEQFIGVVAQKYKIGNDKFPDILISLTEAVNNAIIHGNKEDRAKQVKIDLDKTPLGFSFTVTDEGTGFDPINVPDPTAPENIGCCGGRGVFLIKQLADHVVYHDKGRRVEIRFDV
jgi:serine/threonine-protein kinase RsbW